MFTKVQLYNLALSALLLNQRLNDTTTEDNNEVVVLNQFYDIAFYSTLEDLDLDGTSTKVALELITATPAAPYDELWQYVYKYPTNCAAFRRIHSGYQKDNRASHIPKKVEIYQGQKVILTNEQSAVADILPNDISVNLLDATTGLCIAQRLAYLSAPLIVGKGAKDLRKEILNRYVLYKAEAQEKDYKENYSYYDDAVESEFVATRMS